MMTKTKTAIILMLAGTVTFFTGLWMYSIMDNLGPFEIGAAFAVALIVGVSIYVGINRLKDEKKGLTADDELSELIKQRAAAKSFAYSFYVWVAILIFTIDSGVSIEIPIGIGILAMGLMFVGFWMYYLKNGLPDGNAH